METAANGVSQPEKPRAMAITHLPLALLRQAGSILEALGENGRSFDQQVKFAQVFGYHRTGMIEKAGSLRRFEAGYLDSRETIPSGIPYARGSTMSRMHKLVLKAEAQGLLEGGLEQQQAFHRTAEAAATAKTGKVAKGSRTTEGVSKRGGGAAGPPVANAVPVTPTSPSKAPATGPVSLSVVEGGKGAPEAQGGIWEKLLEIYETDAPAEWPRLQRTLSLTSAMRSRVATAVKIAGSNSELLEILKRALQKVPKFYRETYPVNNDGMKRRATDFLPCLFSGDSRSKDLGPGAWRLFEWADIEKAEMRINSNEEPRPSKFCDWFTYGWRYAPGLTDAQKYQEREDLFKKGLGPRPDWPDNEQCLWHRGLDPDPATIDFPQEVAARIQAQLNGALSNEI